MVKIPTMTKGDAIMLRRARMLGGEKKLVIPGAQLTPAIEGQVLVAYDVGPTVDGFRQPLTTRIDAVSAPDTIVTQDAALADGLTLSRVVVGPDHTLKFANLLDDLRSLPSGVVRRVELDGHYLVEGLPLSDETFAGIQLVGKSWQTTQLEQWNSAINGGKHHALIALGYQAENPAQNPSKDWLRDILISQLTLRVLPNTTAASAAIASFAAHGVEIGFVRTIGGSYEIIVWGGHSSGLYLHDIVCENGGLGGPAEHQSTSAINLLGHDIDAERVRVLGCGQGCELSGHRLRLRDFKLYRRDTTASPSRAVAIGSTGQGAYDIELTDFEMRDYPTALEVANILGSIDSIKVVRPRIHNGTVNIKSGLHFNDPTQLILDAQVHAQLHSLSWLIEPVFTSDDTAPPPSPFSFGQRGKPWMGLESFTIVGATIFLPTHQWCIGGDRNGLAGETSAQCPGGRAGILSGIAAFADYGVPDAWSAETDLAFGVPRTAPVDTGYFYVAIAPQRALDWRDVGVTIVGRTGTTPPVFPTTIGETVVDGTLTWLCSGRLPKVRFVKTRVYGPEHGVDDPGAIRLDMGNRPTPRRAVVFDDHLQNYDWLIVPGGGQPAQRIAANTHFSDSNLV